MENQWERIASDFERRVRYVAGEASIQAIHDTLAAQSLRGDVLELGAGNGTYSSLLAETAKRLWVTDLSNEMLAVCKQGLQGRDNVQMEQQDCCCLSYAEASFDAVVMVNLLHILPNLDQVLTQCRRVLKSGGSLVIISFTTAGMSFTAKLGMAYRYLRAFGKPPAASRRLTLESTHALLEEQGFTIQALSLIGKKTKAVFTRAYSE